jgi:signal transduction histidine kinase
MQIRRPSFFLAFTTLILMGLVVGTALLTANMPTLGITVQSEAGGDVIVQHIDGSAVALPARLVAIDDAAGTSRKVAITGNSDVVRRLEADIGNDNLVAQDAMRTIAATGKVRLWMVGRDGKPVSIVRPVGQRALPATFWILAITGLCGAVIGLWLLTVRVTEVAAQAVAIAGIGLLGAALPVAVTLSSEFIVGGTQVANLYYVNYIFGQLFGAGFALLFATYPNRLFSMRLTWMGFIALALANMPLVLMPRNFAQAYALSNILLLFDLLLFIVLIVMQWLRSKYNPAGRAYLRLIGTVTLISLGLWIALFVVPTFQGGVPLLDFSVGFLLTLPPFMAIALGIGRGHMFDVDRWAWRLFASAATLLAIVLADVALVLVVGLGNGPAASAALLIVGAGWLVVRNRLFDRIMGRDRNRNSLFADAVHVVLAPSREQRFDRWQATLVRLFKPLEIVAATADHAQATTADSGLTLFVPAPPFGHALTLRSAQSGRALFSRDDCDTVDSFRLICERIDADRDAYDRGTREERERIAKDLHDDVSGRLLTSLHRTDATLVRADVRAAISDIRSIVAGLEGQRRQIDEVLATLRHDCGERLEASGIRSDWPLDSKPQDAAIAVEYPIYKALNSAVREAVTNVIRHAQADHVAIAATIDRTQSDLYLRLTIADNGIGISPQDRTGHGTRNIRARIQAIGGDVSYDDSGGAGTTIILTIPLDAPPPLDRGMADGMGAAYSDAPTLPDPVP